MAKDLKVFLFSDEVDHPNEIGLVKQALSLGVEAFHLRKPQWALTHFQNYLDEFTGAELEQFSLHLDNDESSLWEDYPIKRRHYKSNQQIPNRLQSSSSVNSLTDFICSKSVHTPDELESNFGKYHYFFCSPIFDSISKEGYKPKWDFSTTKQLNTQFKNSHSQSLSSQLIALGGVSESNVVDVRKMGFSGAAILGSFWRSKDPIAQLEKVLHA